MLTVIPKQLGKLTVTPAPAKLQPGKTLELTVKLARQYDMPIALKVEAVLPTASAACPRRRSPSARPERGQLIITSSPGASPGTAVITVRATAMFDETVPVVHEAKVNVAVGK